MIELIVGLIILAFICEYVDASLGMGFGTILSPALIFLGYEPIIMVPTVLFSQFLAGLICSGFHHTFENMDLQHNEWQRSAAGIFIATGIFGAVFSSISIMALPSFIIKLYIGFVVLVMGVVMALNFQMGATHSKPRLAGLGLIAAFNKGISGGGYGPVVIGGQIASDIEPRTALAITVLVESLICLVGFVLQILLVGLLDIILLVSVTVGAVVAAPLSAFTTSRLGHKTIKRSISVAMLIIGIATVLTVIV